MTRIATRARIVSMSDPADPSASAATAGATVLPDLLRGDPAVGRGIHSQTLYDGPDVRLVSFSFASGEELSEHTAARPAIVHVLDGDGVAAVGDDSPRPIAAGTSFRIDPGVPHSIRASTPLRMLLYLLPARGGPARSAGPATPRTCRREPFDPPGTARYAPRAVGRVRPACTRVPRSPAGRAGAP